MATITRKNRETKALQAFMAKAKKHDLQALLEWEMSCNTNNNRGHVYDQHEINELYSRHSWDCENGATKICHTKDHNGNNFQYIVVKRFLKHGHVIGGKNQLIEEIKCWDKYAETKDADFLCPILKYFTSKSDKVGKTSETMKENVVIIAQKAVYVSSAEWACKKAEALNKAEGYIGESAKVRYEKLKDMSDRNGWWDAMKNPGNSGVIFDYYKNCYKAVFIDYAL